MAKKIVPAPRPASVDALQHQRRGDALTHETINALIDGVKRESAGELGYADSNAINVRQRKSAQPSYPVWVTADTTIPQHAVIAVWEQQASGTPIQLMGGRAGTSQLGTPLGLFTNDNIEIPTDCKGAVRPLGDYEPFLVKVEGTLPDVGDPCGLVINSWGVGAGRTGFVCLSEPVDMSSEFSGEYVWCMRSQEIGAVLGEVTTEAPAFDEDGDVAGEGVLKVLYRVENTNVLEEAANPATGTAPWLLPFFNLASVAAEEGVKIRVENTLGVGLTFLESEGSSGSGFMSFWGRLDFAVNPA
jgi:hypothetical protein